MTLQEQIRQNRLRSVIAVAGFFFLIAIVAAAIGVLFDLYLGGFAVAGALAYAGFALLRSRALVAGITGAQPVGEDELRPLRRLVDNVSIAAGLPVTPALYLVDDPAPNAFASGLRTEKSFVGVTTGLLNAMPKRELEAVLAHEIAHVRNRDTYLMTVAAVFVGVIAFLADLGFRGMIYGGGRRGRGGAVAIVLAAIGLLLAPYAAFLLRLSLSRRREYLADATGAEIVGDAEAMALALRRLGDDPTTVAHADTAVAHLWIESPTDRVETSRRGQSALVGWFNTHPPLADRIAALEQAGGFVLPERLRDDEPFATELGL